MSTIYEAMSPGGHETYATSIFSKIKTYLDSNPYGYVSKSGDTMTGNLTAPKFIGALQGNATSATTASKLSGFTSTTTSGTAIDSATQNGHVYVNGTSGIYGISDGAAFVQAYSTLWVAQIYQDYRTGQIALRGKNNGTWQAWRKVWDSVNLTSKAAAASGTDLSLVTTGEKAIWNAKGTGTITSVKTTAGTHTAINVTSGAANFNVPTKTSHLTNDSGFVTTDTKNTTGSTDTSSKIFLIGATSQAANPQTYSHDTAYVGTDGCLYSGGTKVLTASGGTLTGALTLANGTKNTIGDDVAIGDINRGGGLAIQGLTGDTNIYFVKKGNAWTNGATGNYAMTWNGSLMAFSGHTQVGGVLRVNAISRTDTGDNGYVNHVNPDNNAYRPVRASAFTTMSCKHTKTNIVDISEEDALKLLDVRPVNFDYVEEVGGQKDQIGVLAEDTYEILPKVVNVPDDYVEEDFDISKGIHQPLPSVDYAKFVPYLIKMVQIQQKEIDILKKERT